MRPGLYAVDVDSGALRWKYNFSPLLPHFKTVSTWRCVAVHPDGKRVNASIGDGRLYILENGVRQWMDARGGPVLVSRFPIVAETGSVGATRDFAIFALGGAYIPIRTGPQGASGNHPHPNSNAIFFFDWEGNLKWRWEGPNRSNGLAFSGNRRWMAIALSKSQTFRRDDTNGIVLFDTKAEPGKYQAGVYWIEGVIPYDQVAMSEDGSLIALVEAPAVIPDGRPARGGYRLHVLF
jgi:hypothetical protein